MVVLLACTGSGDGARVIMKLDRLAARVGTVVELVRRRGVGIILL